MTNIKTVIVLGANRSGTSVTAGIINELGVKMETRRILPKTTFGNPRGFFEDADFVELNGSIIPFNLMDYLQAPRLSEEYLLSKKLCLGQEIQNLVNRRNQQFSLWGWKVPSTVFTVSLFIPYLRNPHFVIVSRNMLHTAKSICQEKFNDDFNKGKMPGNPDLNLEKALTLVSDYNQEILSVLKNNPEIPKIFVAYEDIVKNPAQEAGRLATFLGISLIEEKLSKIKKLVIPREKIRWEKIKAGFLSDVFRKLFKVGFVDLLKMSFAILRNTLRTPKG